jgi:hypothetical protein
MSAASLSGVLSAQSRCQVPASLVGALLSLGWFSLVRRVLLTQTLLALPGSYHVSNCYDSPVTSACVRQAADGRETAGWVLFMQVRFFFFFVRLAQSAVGGPRPRGGLRCVGSQRSVRWRLYGLRCRAGFLTLSRGALVRKKQSRAQYSTVEHL